MEINPRFSNIQSLNKSHFRFMTYRVIFITFLFWICVNLCILAYLMKESSDQVKIKISGFLNPKSVLGRSKEYFIEDYSEAPTNPINWPGEQGLGVEVPKELKNLEKKRYEENQFNVVASDLIALNRYIPDNRMEK